jgi:hypothetical protein
VLFLETDVVDPGGERAPPHRARHRQDQPAAGG